jgi:3-hydroxybutyryl-CoA dehydrogenase
MLNPEQRATSHGFRRVAVVGAGLMGRGIAAVLAAGGLDVVICDVRAEAARDAAEFASDAAARAGHLGQVTGTRCSPMRCQAPTWW